MLRITSCILLMSVLSVSACKENESSDSTSKKAVATPTPIVTPVVAITPLPTAVPTVGPDLMGELALPAASMFCGSELESAKTGFIGFLCSMFAGTGTTTTP